MQSEGPAVRYGRWLLAAIFVAVALVHLLKPETFVAVLPDWVPWPRETVMATGLAEGLGGIGLFFPRLRVAAGIGLALYAVAVFPANIQDAVNDLSTGTGLGWSYHYPRLFAQPLICWWALWAGGIVGRRTRPSS